MNYLVDSSVLIEYLRGRNPWFQRLLSLPPQGGNLCCCDVIVFEVIAGMRDREKKTTVQLLKRLSFLPTSFETALHAGEIKRNLSEKDKTISFPDGIIAAIAIEFQCQLLTTNVKDFHDIIGLDLYQEQ